MAEMNRDLVVFIHPNFSDGGVERTNLILAKGMVSRGISVKFLTTTATEHYLQEILEYGIDLIELGKGSLLSKCLKIRASLVCYSKEYRNVYVIGCQYYVNISLMLISLSLKWRRNYIFFINSERNHLVEFDFRKGLKNWLVPKLVKLLYGYADVVVANSKETAEDLSSLLGREVLSVYNPTINQRIDILKVESIDEEWFHNDPRPYLLSIGRLSLQKDYITLLKAYQCIRHQIGLRLIILGDGEKRNELEEFIKMQNMEGDVVLPGFVANPYKFLLKAEAFVLSSIYEGLPNVLIEALSLEIPCISTNCKSGPSEILSEGRGGLLVPVGDYGKLGDGILEILMNPAKARQRVKYSMQNLDRFKPNHVVPRFIDSIGARA